MREAHNTGTGTVYWSECTRDAVGVHGIGHRRRMVSFSLSQPEDHEDETLERRNDPWT